MRQILLITAQPNNHPCVAQVTQVASLLRAQFMVVNSSDKVPQMTVDLIFWHTYPFDEVMYEQLKVLCPDIIWLVDRQSIGRDEDAKLQTGKPRPPCFVIVAPFDPEEICLMITHQIGWGDE